MSRNGISCERESRNVSLNVRVREHVRVRERENSSVRESGSVRQIRYQPWC